MANTITEQTRNCLRIKRLRLEKIKAQFNLNTTPINAFKQLVEVLKTRINLFTSPI